MSAMIILIAASIAVVVISSICVVSSPDPGLLQDFCVADLTSTGIYDHILPTTHMHALILQYFLFKLN